MRGIRRLVACWSLTSDTTEGVLEYVLMILLGVREEGRVRGDESEQRNQLHYSIQAAKPVTVTVMHTLTGCDTAKVADPSHNRGKPRQI